MFRKWETLLICWILLSLTACAKSPTAQTASSPARSPSGSGSSSPHGPVHVLNPGQEYSEDEVLAVIDAAQSYTLPYLVRYADDVSAYSTYLDEVVDSPQVVSSSEWQAGIREIQHELLETQHMFLFSNEYEEAGFLQSLASVDPKYDRGYNTLVEGMDLARQTISYIDTYLRSGQTNKHALWLAKQSMLAANQQYSVASSEFSGVFSHLRLVFLEDTVLWSLVDDQVDQPEPGVAILEIFFNGEDNPSESDEYVEIANTTGEEVNMSDWRLNAGDPGQDFVFPELLLHPGRSFRLYTNDADDLYYIGDYETGGHSFRSPDPLWNNHGECGYLYDSSEKLVSEYCFGEVASTTSARTGENAALLDQLVHSNKGENLAPYEVMRLGRGDVRDLDVHPDGSSAAIATTAGVWLHNFGGNGDDENVIQNVASWVVSWSPDGQVLAVGTQAGDILLWSNDTKPYRILEGHSGFVTSISWSPDGQLFASSDSDGEVRIWSHKTLSTLFRLGTGSTLAYAVEWSPDGKLIAASLSEAVRIIDVATGDYFDILLIDDYEYEVSSISFSPDGSLLAIGKSDGGIQIFDRQDWMSKQQWVGHAERVAGLVWFLSGKDSLTSLGEDHTVRTWQLSTGQPLSTMNVQVSENLDVVGETGKVFSVIENEKLGLWDLLSGVVIEAVEGYCGVDYGAWEPDSTSIFVSMCHGQYGLAGIGRDFEPHFDGPRAFIGYVSLSPSGAYVVLALADGRMTLWDAQLGIPVAAFDGAAKWIDTIAWSPDSEYVVFASRDDSIEVWRADTQQFVMTLIGNTENAADVEWSPNGKQIAAGILHDSAMIWDAGTADELARFDDYRLPVIDVTWSPDGRKLALGSWDGTVRIYELGSQTDPAVVRQYGEWIWSTAWSPTGNVLAVGLENGEIEILDTETWERVKALRGHQDLVRHVAWSSDGKFLLSLSDDSTLRVWEP